MARSVWIATLLAIVGCSYAPARDGSPAETVTPSIAFLRDGFPFTPWTVPVRGTVERPAPGDLVLVDGVIMTVGPEADQDFVTPAEDDGRVLLAIAGGHQRVVGARVAFEGEDDRRRLLNPLEGMALEELRGLRGVRLDEWNEVVERALGSMDSPDLCVTIGWGLAERDPGVVTRLPRTIHHLRFEPDRLPGVWERFPTRPSIDARDVAKLTELRSLDLAGLDVRNPEALDLLAKLQIAKGEATPRFGTPLEALRHAVGLATRMLVRSGGTCDRDPRRESTLFETEDRTCIRDLLARIQPVAPPEPEPADASGCRVIELSRCMCCGDPTIEFYRGERLIVSLGLHHGQAVRWPGGPFLGDAELQPESRESLARWLDGHGVPGPLNELHPARQDSPQGPH